MGHGHRRRDQLAGRDGSVVSYGTLALNDGRKADGATVFEIASLTKVLTALVLADMARQGQVKPRRR